MSYNFKKLQEKWKSKWIDDDIYGVYRLSKKKYYVIHKCIVPNRKIDYDDIRTLIFADILARFKRMNGFNVLFPIGWNSLNIYLENTSYEHGLDPSKWTIESISDMREQLKTLGISYDWNRELITQESSYYKWTQYLFLQLFYKGTVYKKESLVYWCSHCKTSLLEGQIMDGICKNCKAQLSIKTIGQWYLKISDYAERLLEDVDNINFMPDYLKTVLKQIVGKTEGIEMELQIRNSNIKIKLFTENINKLNQSPYIVISPDNPIIYYFFNKTEHEELVREILDKRYHASEDGIVFLEKFAVNPITKEDIPIYISNYLFEYYGYKIKLETKKNTNISEVPIKDYIEKLHIGKKTVKFKLKDWLISRQNFFGVPIPIVTCNRCGIVPINEDTLPVLLPSDIKPIENGKYSLEGSREFINTKCPKCSRNAVMETSVLDSIFNTCWIFFRYIDPNNDKELFDRAIANYWMKVDTYLTDRNEPFQIFLYYMFMTRILYDFSLSPVDELFDKIFYCIDSNSFDSELSGKEKEDLYFKEAICKYGVDVVRIFTVARIGLCKKSRFENIEIHNIYKSLSKVYNLVLKIKDIYNESISVKRDKSNKKDTIMKKVLYSNIKKVTDSIEQIDKLYLAITSIEKLTDEISKYIEDNNQEIINMQLLIEAAKSLIIILAPFAPYLSEEMWAILGNNESVHLAKWPLIK